MGNINNPHYSVIKGISQEKQTGRYRAKISGKSIGTFDTEIEAMYDKIIVERIFQNVLEKLDIESFYFNREEKISIEVLTTTGELLSVNTDILYSNFRKKSRGLK